MFVNDFFLQNLMQFLVNNNELGYIVVDEAYHESYWLLGDTEEYNGLRNLRNRLHNVPWIITTANGSAEVNIKRISIGFKNFK